MQRVLLAAACGLAAGFRMKPNNASASEPAALVEAEAAAPQRAICSLSGDPHILTFDASWQRGHMWHATQAPGHWWLVRTATGKIKVQATYSYCSGATCMSGLAVGGSFIGSKLVVQPACDWDIKTRRCQNGGGNTPRITWKGVQVSGVNENGVVVTQAPNKIKISLPEGMEIDVHVWHQGFMNVVITMVQGSGGDQCGHCGNFNGNWQDDIAYGANGAFSGNNDKQCDAAVPCTDRLIPGDPACNGVISNEDCPEELRAKAEKVCREKMAADVDPAVAGKIPVTIQEDELLECVMDTCVDPSFADDDAQQDEVIDEAIIKMNR